MHEAEVQPVLRCEQCNKPFDKHSTLKRHGYYCRSRKGVNAHRSRSCTSCAKRKARCNNERPRCSRCITRGIECHYPANIPKIPSSRTQYNNNVSNESHEDSPPLVMNIPVVQSRQESNNNSDIILDAAPIVLDPGIAIGGGDFFDWNNLEKEFADFLDPQTNDQYPSVELSSLVRSSPPPPDQTVQAQQFISSSNTSIPTMSTYTLRSLVPRTKMQTGPQRIANLMLHTLKSYPLMMLRHNSLPPFIHPGLITSDAENDSMEPLTNCISLVHMISNGVRGSRKLFWKNVRLECERLCEERQNLSKWGLLAAMQALSVYILMRLHEGETDHNNYDFLLLTTVTVIAHQITCSDTMCNTPSAQCSYGLDLSWRDWIFEESRRRLSVIYRVVNMLIHFEPAALCTLQKDLILAPLPAKKQLWEASDESIWKVESEREPGGVQAAFALAANGELVKLDEGQLYCTDAVLLYKSVDARTPSRSPAIWEEWCSGIDGFGGLVMLAASMIV